MRRLILGFTAFLFSLAAQANDGDIWYPVPNNEGKYYSSDITLMDIKTETLGFRYLTDGDVVGGYDGRLVQDVRLNCRDGIVEILKQTMTLPDGSEDPEWGASKPYSYRVPFFARSFGELCRGEILEKAMEKQGWASKRSAQ